EVNDRAIELFGDGRRQDLFVATDAYWPESATAVFADSVVAAVSGQTNFVRETTMRTMAGVEFDAELAGHFDPENVSGGLVTIAVVDISERNRARAASEHAQFMYRNLFEGMVVPFLRLDSAGLTDMFRQLREEGISDLAEYMNAHPEFVGMAMDASIIVEANEAAARLYAATSAAQLRGPISRFFAPGREQALRTCFAAGYAGQAAAQVETR